MSSINNPYYNSNNTPNGIRINGTTTEFQTASTVLRSEELENGTTYDVDLSNSQLLQTMDGAMIDTETPTDKTPGSSLTSLLTTPTTSISKISFKETTDEDKAIIIKLLSKDNKFQKLNRVRSVLDEAIGLLTNDFLKEQVLSMAITILSLKLRHEMYKEKASMLKDPANKKIPRALQAPFKIECIEEESVRKVSEYQALQDESLAAYQDYATKLRTLFGKAKELDGQTSAGKLRNEFANNMYKIIFARCTVEISSIKDDTIRSEFTTNGGAHMLTAGVISSIQNGLKADANYTLEYNKLMKKVNDYLETTNFVKFLDSFLLGVENYTNIKKYLENTNNNSKFIPERTRLIKSTEGYFRRICNIAIICVYDNYNHALRVEEAKKLTKAQFQANQVEEATAIVANTLHNEINKTPQQMESYIDKRVSKKTKELENELNNLKALLQTQNQKNYGVSIENTTMETPNNGGPASKKRKQTKNKNKKSGKQAKIQQINEEESVTMNKPKSPPGQNTVKPPSAMKKVQKYTPTTDTIVEEVHTPVFHQSHWQEPQQHWNGNNNWQSTRGQYRGRGRGRRGGFRGGRHSGRSRNFY